MPYEFRFPDVGEGITEGEVVEWKVKAGDKVAVDQVLAEIETDKAIVEIPSPRAGTILRIYSKPGDTIKVGDILVTIGEAGEALPAAAKPEPAKPAAPATEKPRPQAKPAETRKQEKDAGSVVGQLDTKEVVIPSPQTTAQQPAVKETLAMPYVRQLAKEKGVDISKLAGSGPGGRITLEDVNKAAQPQKQPAAAAVGLHSVKKYDMWGYVEHVPLKGIRKTTAKKMVESFYTIPHVTHMDECDVTALWEIHGRFKQRFEKEVKLTFLPFIIKAVIAGIKEYPFMNSSMDEENGEIIVKKYCNIGIAIDIDDGLMVPVIKGADNKSILDIAKDLASLSKKAQERTIDLADLKGGTFTITNIGVLGGRFATPIINYPEAAILGVGKIYDKVVAIDGKIAMRKVLPLSLAFDHRIIDGAYAARFTNTVMRHLEDPDLMLVERD